MIRLATGRRALFGAMLAIALLALVPMRAVLGWVGLGDLGLTAREATGSLWAGRLVEARFGAVALGDLDARLAFWPLLLGRARLELDGEGERPLSGAVTVSRHRLGLDDMTANLITGQLFAPLPVTTLDLEDATVHFRDGVCEKAEGRVRATLAGEAGGVALPQTLSGPARCASGATDATARNSRCAAPTRPASRGCRRPGSSAGRTGMCWAWKGGSDRSLDGSGTRPVGARLPCGDRSSVG
jgi:general secretion pathway protein N